MIPFEAFSWVEFISIAILMGIFSVSIFWMRNYSRNHHLSSTDLLEKIADWIPFISTIAVLILFVALNPVTHLIIAVAVLVLCYGIFRNLILGIPLRPLYRSLKGKWVSAANQEGIMLSFDRKGIYLARNDTKSFIPNSVLHSSGIQALQYDLPVSIHLECSIPPESIEKSIPFYRIMDRIMAMPYTIGKVNVKPMGNTLFIDAKLISENYGLRFIKALEELNIVVKSKSKII